MINIKKIINIKKLKDILKYNLNEPIFNRNYIFHYLIILKNLNALKLTRYPIYLENGDYLNGFHLLAKEYDYNILTYLIEKYPEYIYNRNEKKETFAYYLPYNSFNKLIKKYPKLNWHDLIDYGSSTQYLILIIILTNLNFKELQKFIKLYKLQINDNNQFIFYILSNENISPENKITLLDNFTLDELNIKSNNNSGLIMNAFDNQLLFDYLIKKILI